MYSPHALQTVSPVGERRHSGVCVVLQLLRSVSLLYADVGRLKVSVYRHTGHETGQATYLQTCPIMGALSPPTLRGGSDNEVDGAGEVTAPAIGTASSREW